MQTSIKDIKRFLSIFDSQKYVPIFQRLYSWTTVQCQHLFSDMENLILNKENTHFLGSVVLGPIESFGGINKQQIIDGQQRITTIILSIIAFCYSSKINNNDNKEQLINTFLINQYEKLDLSKKYKLNLIKSDQDILSILIDSIFIDKSLEDIKCDKNSNLYLNFEFFLNKFNSSNITFELFISVILEKLTCILIELDNNEDPQLIFECMNSTGLDLEQGDLIKNYLLLSFDQKTQMEIYRNYWSELEEFLTRENKKLDLFFKHYLTIKTFVIPSEKSIYSKLKLFCQNNKFNKNEIIKDIYDYFLIYKSILIGGCGIKEIDIKIETITSLNFEVVNPLLIQLIYYVKINKITNIDNVKKIIGYLESYIIRRSFCDLPTASMNKIFCKLIKFLDDENWFYLIVESLLKERNTGLFPNDDLFKNKFIHDKNFYDMRLNKKILNILEMSRNTKNKELINAMNNSTLEHILPKGDNVPDYWKNELGENWHEDWIKYVNTIGNITYTNYNSEMGNKSFNDKKTMSGGFLETNFWLNKSVNNKNKWNKNSIIDRAKELFDQAKQTWPYPNEIKIQINEDNYSLDDYHFSDITLKLIEEFEEKINYFFHEQIERECKKWYMNYKIKDKIIFCLVGKSNSIEIGFDNENNIIKSNFFEIIDKSNIGCWGTKKYRVEININNIKNVIDIIKQVFYLNNMNNFDY